MKKKHKRDRQIDCWEYCGRFELKYSGSYSKYIINRLDTPVNKKYHTRLLKNQKNICFSQGELPKSIERTRSSNPRNQ